jgi:hypothetical protein
MRPVAGAGGLRIAHTLSQEILGCLVLSCSVERRNPTPLKSFHEANECVSTPSRHLERDQ